MSMICEFTFYAYTVFQLICKKCSCCPVHMPLLRFMNSCCSFLPGWLEERGDIHIKPLPAPRESRCYTRVQGNWGAANAAAHSGQSCSPSSETLNLKTTTGKWSNDISVSATNLSALHMSGICTAQWKTDTIQSVGSSAALCVACTPRTHGSTTGVDLHWARAQSQAKWNVRPFPNCSNRTAKTSCITFLSLSLS